MSDAAELALARASERLREHDWVGTREALLAAWRVNRSSGLAELIEALDTEAPDDLRRALDGLAAPRWATMLERFASVSDVDDPRVSGYAIEALRRPPFTTPYAQPLLEAFVTAVRRRRDARLLAVEGEICEALRTRLTRLLFRETMLAWVDEAARALEAMPQTEASALEVALRERLAPLSAGRHREAELLSLVYARPDDDAPRRVLADWLLERGEPRGEFIALQLRKAEGTLDAAGAARERELLARHGKAWLGALAPVATFGKSYSGTTFARGFVSTLDVMGSVGKKLEPLWGAPEWSTVEQLEGSWPLELLERAKLPALKRIDRTMSQPILEGLARGGVRLPAKTVEVHSELQDWTLLRRVLPALECVESWWHGVPSLDDLRRLSALGLERLELRRAWNAPRGPAEDAAFERLLEVLRVTPLPLAELALAPAWAADGARPQPIELRPTATGFG